MERKKMQGTTHAKSVNQSNYGSGSDRRPDYIPLRFISKSDLKRYNCSVCEGKKVRIINATRESDDSNIWANLKYQTRNK